MLSLDFLKSNWINLLILLIVSILMMKSIKKLESFEDKNKVGELEPLEIPATAKVEPTTILNKDIFKDTDSVEKEIKLTVKDMKSDPDPEIVPPDQIRSQNYKEPQDLSEVQLRVFKSKFRIDYTIKDYNNWLNLYIKDDNVDILQDVHKVNAKILKRGGTLNPSDLPQLNVLPSSHVPLNNFFDIYKNKNVLLPTPFSTITKVTDEGSGYLNPAKLGEYKITGIKLKRDFTRTNALDTERFIGPTLSSAVSEKHFFPDTPISTDGAAIITTAVK